MTSEAKYSQTYRKNRERLKREAPHICALCGLWIDVDLPRKDPMSWQADHIIPLAKGGTDDYGNLQPAHSRLLGATDASVMRRGHRLKEVGVG